MVLRVFKDFLQSSDVRLQRDLTTAISCATSVPTLCWVHGVGTAVTKATK